MKKLILLLTLLVVLAVAALGTLWVTGNNDCKRRLKTLFTEARYRPLVGCEISITHGNWHAERDFKKAVEDIKEGAEKATEKVFGK
jgi:hypothetical protein